jgi:hypothetical protein
MISKEVSQTSENEQYSETLISRHLAAAEHIVSLDRVMVVAYGVYLCWILEFYNNLDLEEKNKVGKTAHEFYIQDESVMASLAYYKRYTAVLDARILLNNVYYDPTIASSKEIASAEHILRNVEGQIDPLLVKAKD